MAGSPRIFVCKKCNKKKRASSPVGRLPVYCDKCNPRKRDTRARENKRDRSRVEGRRRQVTAADMQNAGRMAVGMSFHASAEDAARWAGIEPDVMHVGRLADLARAHYKEIIEGNVTDLGKRLVGVMNLILISTAHAIDEISPRDRINGLRQLASARDLLVGQDQSSDFAQINLTIIGADGEPVSVIDADG